MKTQYLERDHKGFYLNVTNLRKTGSPLLKTIFKLAAPENPLDTPSRIMLTYKQFESIESDIQVISEVESRTKDRLLFTPTNGMEVEIIDAPEE